MAHAATILVLGDSLSAGYGLQRDQGWVDLLGKKVAGQHQVVNASVSGETSAGGRSRVAVLLQQHRPGIVIVELGGNDALRGLPLNTTTDNLSAIVQLSQQAGAKVLLVGMQMPANYGKAYNEKFSAVYRQVSEQRQVRLMPLFLAPLAGKREAFQVDGIHPVAAAQPLLLEAIWPYLKPLLK
ncbi:arylesterase [Leeia sp. IMCC25680]|uniref:Arylesterase n=2 Tax=Leeia aquatica TaxID=2725557 RepID=A0A847S552_9NEIS|nr:arylesterase [Leeia aquatica]